MKKHYFTSQNHAVAFSFALFGLCAFQAITMMQGSNETLASVFGRFSTEPTIERQAGSRADNPMWERQQEERKAQMQERMKNAAPVEDADTDTEGSEGEKSSRKPRPAACDMVHKLAMQLQCGM